MPSKLLQEVLELEKNPNKTKISVWCIWNTLCNAGNITDSSRFPLHKACLGFKFCNSPCLERKVGIVQYWSSWSGNSNSEMPLGILMKNQLNASQLTKQTDMIISLNRKTSVLCLTGTKSLLESTAQKIIW